MWDEWSYPQLLLPRGLINPRIKRIIELCKRPRCFSIKLHSKFQVSDRLNMPGGKSSRHAQNPLSGEFRNTLSITNPALSLHPHVIICASFISSMDCTVFIVSQCPSKRHNQAKIIHQKINIFIFAS